MRGWFSRPFKSFLLPYIIITFLFASLKYLLILKTLTETPLRISSSVIGRCSVMPTSHWLQGKCAGINLSPAAWYYFTGSRAASCKHVSVKIAILGSLKRVIERIFKIRK